MTMNAILTQPGSSHNVLFILRLHLDAEHSKAWLYQAKTLKS